jgi:hypothetical protein
MAGIILTLKQAVCADAAVENQETSQAPRTEGGSTNSAPEGSNPPPFQVCLSYRSSTEA